VSIDPFTGLPGPIAATDDSAGDPFLAAAPQARSSTATTPQDGSPSPGPAGPRRHASAEAPKTQQPTGRESQRKTESRRVAGVVALCLTIVAAAFLGLTVFETLASIRIYGGTIATSFWSQVFNGANAACVAVLIVDLVVLVKSRHARLVPAIALIISVLGPAIACVVGAGYGVHALVTNIQQDAGSVTSSVTSLLGQANIPSWLSWLSARFNS